MREYKFRGKRLDNGEWIYGSLRVWTDGTEFPQNYYIAEFEHWGSGYEIDPKTVGQHTGLLDKNGLEIYEGDVVKDPGKYPVGYTHDFTNQAAVVEYVTEYGGWFLNDKRRMAKELHQPKAEKYEIIGNIYENPDLLRQERLGTKEEIQKNVANGATVYSDEHGSYRLLGRRGYQHQTINHSQHSYVVGRVHTQNIENFWSIFKRGVYGVYRHCDSRYLQNYADEYAWRFSNRKLGGAMFDLLLAKARQ